MLALNVLWLQERSQQYRDKPCASRRGFLKLTALTIGGLMVSPALAELAAPRERTVKLYNPNTGETLHTVYWTPRDGYRSEVLQQLNWLLRDHHNDQVKSIDPVLLDQLYALQTMIDLTMPFHVISAYRSPSTNAELCRVSRRVARNSYHLQGRAVDIRIPGRSVATLQRAAMSLQAGGVGYYPQSDFIHIDTGPVRHWS